MRRPVLADFAHVMDPLPASPRPPALRGIRLGLALVWVTAVVLLYLADRELRLTLVP